MPSFTLAPFIIGGIIGLAVHGLLLAVFLRVASHWVAKVEIPFGKAFGLAIRIALLNSAFAIVIVAGLSGADTPRWLPFGIAYVVGAVVAAAILRQRLAVRWGEGALIYVVSTLLGYGLIGATAGMCALAL